MPQPLAVELYQRVLKGESIEKLSRDLGIPVDRIESRIRAATAYTERKRKLAA